MLSNLRDLAISLLADALRIYSPSKREDRLARFLMEKMSNELAFKNVRMDNGGNVIGEIGDGQPCVLLCGHMDTVPGIQPVKVTNDFIYGRGAVDAKSSLISMIMAASGLDQNNGIGKVIVAGVTDEEGEGSGIKELIKGGINVSYAVFGEPSGIGKITVGYKGRASIKVTCETPPIHASAPWMSQNAIEKSFEVWQAISQYVMKNSNGKDRHSTLSACLTKIRGGTAENVMPGICQFIIDVRFPSKYTGDYVYGELERVVNQLQGDGQFPKISIELMDSTPAFEASMSSPITRALTRAIIQTRGVKPKYVHKTGTGDMNVLGHTMKIPVVTYGPGDSHLSHTSKERIEIAEYITSIGIYQSMLKNLSAMI